MGKCAFLFPGQGSQYVGMGKLLCEHFTTARQIFEQADQLLGRKLSQVMWEGPEETLKQTQNTQPAIFVASVAAFKVLESKGSLPDRVAGHSLGEYSALVAAGTIDFENGLKIVQERGRLMEEAGRKTPGAMAALLGLPLQNIQEICQTVSMLGVCEAVNFNSPDQVVIAGGRAAIEKALSLAMEKGAKRAVALNVSGAFHSSLMSKAAQNLEKFLECFTFLDARCAVISNCDAQPSQEGRVLKKKLVTQIDHPVLWEQSIQSMIREGVDSFIEVGPGRVLTSLLKRIDRSKQCFCVDDDPTFEKTITEVNPCGFKEKSL